MSFLPFLIILSLTPDLLWAFCPNHCECDDALKTVNCTSKSAPNELSVIPISLNPMIEKLHLRNNGIRAVDVSLQFYGQLVLADFSHNDISGELPKRCFSSQRKLVELILDSNRISNVTEDTFIGLKALKRLSIRDNRLVNLSANVFKHLEKLEILDLSGNQINMISESAFNNIGSIQYLRLSSNNLNQIPKLESLQNLNSFDISYNRNLTNIKQNAFSSNFHLKTLNLSHCGVENLSFEALQPLRSSLETIDISGNVIQSLETINLSPLINLRKLYLGGNLLQVLKRDCLSILPNLELLDVSVTLTLIRVESEAFSKNSHLESLNFNGCHNLKAIEQNAFHIINSESLSVSFKNMTWRVIPKEIFLPKSSITAINLDPLPCDCHSTWLLDLLLTTSNPNLANNSHIFCSSPLNLRHRSLKTIDKSDLICQSESSYSQTTAKSDVIEIESHHNNKAFDWTRILLVTACVTAALLTGFFIILMVHCRRRFCEMCSKCHILRSGTSSSTSTSSSTMVESPIEQCLCCDLTISGKTRPHQHPILRNQLRTLQHPHDYLAPRPMPFQTIHHHNHPSHHQHQQLPLLYNQDYTLPTSNHHYAEPNTDYRTSLDFNTVKTKSSFCEDEDDYFLSLSTSQDRHVIKPIPVSEL